MLQCEFVDKCKAINMKQTSRNERDCDITAIHCKEFNYMVCSDTLISIIADAIFRSEFAPFVKTVRTKCA